MLFLPHEGRTLPTTASLGSVCGLPVKLKFFSCWFSSDLYGICFNNIVTVGARPTKKCPQGDLPLPKVTSPAPS